MYEEIPVYGPASIPDRPAGRQVVLGGGTEQT